MFGRLDLLLPAFPGAFAAYLHVAPMISADSTTNALNTNLTDLLITVSFSRFVVILNSEKLSHSFLLSIQTGMDSPQKDQPQAL